MNILEIIKSLFNSLFNKKSISLDDVKSIVHEATKPVVVPPVVEPTKPTKKRSNREKK